MVRLSPPLRSAGALLVALALALALAGCASSKVPRVYEQETFDGQNAFSREFVADPADTCNAARRALLSQGYVVRIIQADQMEAHKRFQPDGESHVQIQFNIVCSPTAKGQPTSVAFVSAVQDRYTVKKTSTSASVGVGPIGSISLPFTSGNDSLVKVASETIPTGAFYNRFFDLVEQFLADAKGLNEPAVDAVRAMPASATGRN
jgi:hypothetical protein